GQNANHAGFIHVAAIFFPLGPYLIGVYSRAQGRCIKHPIHAALFGGVVVEPDLGIPCVQADHDASPAVAAGHCPATTRITPSRSINTVVPLASKVGGVSLGFPVAMGDPIAPVALATPVAIPVSDVAGTAVVAGPIAGAIAVPEVAAADDAIPVRIVPGPI